MKTGLRNQGEAIFYLLNCYERQNHEDVEERLRAEMYRKIMGLTNDGICALNKKDSITYVNEDAEERLHAEMYRKIVELTNDGIWVLDNKGFTTFVNKAMCDMIGYSSDEMVGRALFNFLPKEERLIFNSALKLPRQGKNERLESQLLHKNGSKVDISVSASPMTDDSGRITGAFAVITDISVVKKQKRKIELVEYMRENEVLMSELNRRTDLAKISAGLSHEINNPLAFVKQSISTFQKYILVFEHFIRHTKKMFEEGMSLDDYCELLEKFQIDQSIAQMHKKISTSNRGIDRIVEVVNSLKLFSRRDISGIDEVDINRCIDIASEIVINSSHRINLIKEYSELPAYPCEPAAINQCIYQILDNAVQAVKCEGTIRIATAYTSEKADVITIRIEDDGVGMSEDTMKKAFIPFFTTRDVGAGKGLGLSMVRGILNRHGGTIEIESKEGKGTSVTIRLPLVCSLPEAGVF
ncbi:MAG: PAS domain S-box protein [Candidatus Magnetominusculus sp. LBB02]|nr:PAS domain S-box protein [Candidatus Magnetominusculus sp. LBB02]